MLFRSFLFIAVAVNVMPFATAQVSLDIGIGSTGLAGNSVQRSTAGSWNVTGAGNDIWGSYDQFHFLYFNKTNDCTATVLVEGFKQNNAWSKGGLMIRDDLTGGSAHASVFWTGGNLIAMQSRENAGGSSLSYHSGFPAGNMWLRIVKEGNTVTSYYKRENDHGFMKFYSRNINFADNQVSVGIAVTSHLSGELATLTTSGFEVSNEVFTLPSRDIGNVGKEVLAQEITDGKWSIKGAGTGIGGTSDHFAYLNYPQSGDVTATVHIDRLEERNMQSKGGLMIRASHSPDAAHVSLVTTRDKGVTMVWRANDGGETESKNVGVWQSDMDLKLEKTGNSVSASYKHAGSPSWFTIGSAVVALPENFRVGLAVTSADYGQHATLYADALTVV